METKQCTSQSYVYIPYYLQLIEAKFGAGNGVDVNYTAFVQSIDDEYIGQAMENDTSDKRYEPLMHAGRSGHSRVHGMPWSGGCCSQLQRMLFWSKIQMGRLFVILAVYI